MVIVEWPFGAQVAIQAMPSGSLKHGEEVDGGVGEGDPADGAGDAVAGTEVDILDTEGGEGRGDKRVDGEGVVVELDGCDDHDRRGDNWGMAWERGRRLEDQG